MGTNDIETSQLYIYVNPIVSLIALILSLLIVVILSNNEFKDSFYKYLKIQSIFVALNSLLIVLQPIKYCDNCSVSKTYFAQIYFIYLRIYSSSIFEMVTLYCSWLSGLNCCVLLFNKRIAKFILKLIVHYYILLMVIVLFSTLLFVHQIFEYEIVLCNETRFHSFKTNFANTSSFRSLEKNAVAFRDGFSIVFLLIINVILLSKIKQIMKDKLNLLSSNLARTVGINNKLNIHKDGLTFFNATTTTTTANKIAAPNQRKQSKLDKTKKKQIFTILTNCLICLVGRLPILICFLIRNDLTREINSISFSWASIFVQISYCVNFFSFYFFNQRFKKVTNCLFFHVYYKFKSAII